MSKQSILEVDGFGTKIWKLNGKYHREDGPAIEHLNGTKQWFLNGNRNRIDGPAIEWSNGNKYWYLNGIEYSTKEKWFQHLTSEQQYNYLWNLDE
jgi:hypothetical protein